VQHFLPFGLFVDIADQFKFGQVKPLAQRSRGDGLDDLPRNTLDGVPCILESLSRGGEKKESGQCETPWAWDCECDTPSLHPSRSFG
jgi:hypothetical protein